MPRPLRPASPSPHQRLTDTADRKSTRLNSSHITISYAVSCLKKNISYYKTSAASLAPRASFQVGIIMIQTRQSKSAPVGVVTKDLRVQLTLHRSPSVLHFKHM